MQPIIIRATTIPDAWFQCLYTLWEEHQENLADWTPTATPAVRRYMVQSGSEPGIDRVEFDFITVHINLPGERPLLPKMPEHLDLPEVASEEQLGDYIRYLLTTDRQPNESYTYGERITKQFEYVTQYYKNHGPGTNRMCIEVGRPQDLHNYDDLQGSTPCLRLIDTRIKDNKLHWIVYFRSWNLWSGFPVNLAGLQIAKEIMAAQIGVEDGCIIASSKGLNLRTYHLELAARRLQREPL